MQSYEEKADFKKNIYVCGLLIALNTQIFDKIWVFNAYLNCCRRAMYLPRMSNSMFTTVPILMSQKFVCSNV